MGWQGTNGVIQIRGQPVSVALPPVPFYPTATNLVATLSSAADNWQPLGIWEFSLSPSAAAGRLTVSPSFLDQAFLILDHPNSPPLGHVHHLVPPPADTRALDLTLHRSGAFSEATARYHLQWPSDAARAKDLESWRRQAVSPVDWFYVELTSHCNLSCPFCPSRLLKRPRAFMTLDHARTIFSKIGAYVRRRDATWGYTETDRMVFLHVMGEPLLHPRFVDIVGVARQAGLVPGLFTNATLLNAKSIGKIFDAGLSHITISLNVTGQEGYSQLGARDGIDDQEQRVIALLRERNRRGAHRLHLDIQYIVSAGHAVSGRGLVESRQQAWACYRKWLLLLRHLEPAEHPAADRRPSIALETLGDPLADKTGDPSLRLPLDVGVDLVMKSGCSFGNAVIPSGKTLRPASRGRCPFDSPWRQMAVFVDGSVSFCNMDHENSVNLGSLLDSSVEALWDSPRLQRIRREMTAERLTEPLCRRCLGTVVPQAGHP